VNPNNVISSGSLVRASTRNGVAIHAGPGMKPGQGQRAEVTIVNLGALPAAFRLRENNASNGFAPGRLGLAIHELDGQARRRLFLGEIGSVPPEGIDLGRFEAGESRSYRFIAMLSKDTPAEELDRAAGAAYEWLAAVVGGR
jgi:hypothetical protein